MNDLKFALRMLRKNPGFALVAVLTLAFGIAVNSNIFAILGTVLYRPLPIPNGQEVVMVLQRSAAFNLPHGISYPDFRDYRERNGVFSDLAASFPSPAHLGVAGQPPERTWVEVVSPNYLALAGGGVALGRAIRIDEGERMGDGPVVVLSHAYWQRRFGGDRQIIGRSIQINGQPFTVVGVAS